MKSNNLLLAFISSFLSATDGVLTLIVRDARVKSILALTGLHSPDEPFVTSLNRQVALLTSPSPAL